jgi:methionyl-tRNA synthetase
MSKSLGNVVDPFEVVAKHGADALRFWLLKEMPTFEDGDFTWERFAESYNAHLANGLGNLASRIIKMAVSNDVKLEDNDASWTRNDASGTESPYRKYMDTFELKKAADDTWARFTGLDKAIQDKEPFKLVKAEPEKGREEIRMLLQSLCAAMHELEPFMPETANKIRAAIREHRPLEPLFPRIGEPK